MRGLNACLPASAGSQQKSADVQWVSESFEKCSTNGKSLITQIVQGLSEKQKEGLQALKVECEGFPVA